MKVKVWRAPVGRSMFPPATLARGVSDSGMHSAASFSAVSGVKIRDILVEMQHEILLIPR